MKRTLMQTFSNTARNQSCDTVSFRRHSTNRRKFQIAFILNFLFLIPFNSFCQTRTIEVNANGTVNFGYHVNIAKDLYVGGNIFTTTSNLTIGCYNNSAPDIHPNSYNTGRIRDFAEIYTATSYASQALFTSDKRLKENFRKIETPLGKILKMDGLKYDFISQDKNTSDSINTEKSASLKQEKNRLGFIAQDLETILPEAVYHAEKEDRYYIDYNAIIPVIVEAMKEQQVRIESLESEINKLKIAQSNKSAFIETGGGNSNNNESENGKSATLAQNIPNPFSESTRIAIFLPKSVNQALLNVYNLQGIQIQSFTLSQRGNTSVTIEGNSLKAGMYLYTLIADGKEVDTKKMILTN
jgi:hypothetical protein